MMLQEFLQSHAGTFTLLMMSALVFFLAGMASIWRWKPRLIVMGELIIVSLVLMAWLVDNLLVTILLAWLFIISLALILLAWYMQRRIRHHH